MTLHLIKLCVGVESIADFEARIAARLKAGRGGNPSRKGDGASLAHVTRMTPKRVNELLDGGSLYWVIKGQLCARQRLLRIEPFVDSAGVARCALELDTRVVPVRPRPCRAFQGWRYLAGADAPPDLSAQGGAGELPEALRRELSDLGLL